MKVKGQMKYLVEVATQAGWHVEPTKGLHLRFLAPDGVTIIIAPGTPSDHRSYRNTRAALRRVGLDVR